MSLDLESTLNLQADAKAVAALLKRRGGRLHADADEDALATYWLEIVPAHDPSETYFARVGWTTYPGAPPSVKFAPEVGGRLDLTTAWPIVPGFRPTAFDICMPFTAEGFAVHPEWVTSAEAWKDTGNPFLYVTSTLQRLLDTAYSGRHA
jgi:hypothetical protein